jgi:hypothetical protein
MNPRRQNSSTWWAVALAVLLFGIWSQQRAHSDTLAHSVQRKTVALSPASLPVSTAFLTGRLDGLTVVSRVDTKTGKSEEGPDLRATLRLRNTTTDQAIQLLSGSVEYVNADGAVIPLAKDQGNAGFSFYPDERDGLLPGHEISQAVRVPFPVAGVKADTLRDIRLHFTYRAIPYRNETVDGRVTLPG